MFTCCESIKQFCFDLWCCMGDLHLLTFQTPIFKN